MLIVKTYVDNSPVHGRGLFADEDILPGTVIWRAGYELLFSPKHFERLSAYEKSLSRLGGWKDLHNGFIIFRLIMTVLSIIRMMPTLLSAETV